MISIIEISPIWFQKYNLMLELFFAFISWLIFWFSLRTYRITRKNEAKILSKAFLFISLSYLLEFLFNLLSILKVIDKTASIPWSYAILKTTAIYSHKLFMIIGLITLFMMTIKEKKKEIFLILSSISILTISFQNSCWLSFFILNTIFLLFITRYYLKNYNKKKGTKTFLTLTAFTLLTLANISLAVTINNHNFYVLSQMLILGAYLCLLIDFYIIFRIRK